jgi:hypothetical protein
LAPPPAARQPQAGERRIHEDDALFRKGVRAKTRATKAKQRGGARVYEHVHLPDRAALLEATDLIAAYGDLARIEAAQRADRSRSLGNVIHFCRWRQIERTIAMLADEEVTGTTH